MKTKEYLQQAYYLDQAINDNLNTLRALKIKAKALSNLDISKEAVQGRKRQNRIADTIPQIIDLEEQIKAKIEEQIKVKQDIEKSISKIKDIKSRTVLTKRYMHFKPWEQIAEDLNKSLSRIFDLHGKGIKSITNSSK